MTIKRQIQSALRKTRSLLKRGRLTSEYIEEVQSSFHPLPQKDLPALFNFTVDFELSWGNGRLGDRDHPTSRRKEAAEKQLENFEAFTKLIEEVNFPTSWATLGILANQNIHSEEAQFQPTWSKTNWYEPPEEIKKIEALYNGENLIKHLLKMKSNVELLSHGYAHIDYSDPSTTPEIAMHDLKWANQSLSQWGNAITGFAFPCNNVGHVNLLQEAGIRVFRGNTNQWKVAKNLIETPIGFWLSPGRMSWSDLKEIIDYGIEKKSYIHPWMHLIECDLKQKDLDYFYRPLFEYINESESKGRLKTVSYKMIDSLLSS